MKPIDSPVPAIEPASRWAGLRVNIAIAVGLAACPLIVLTGVAADLWM